MSRWYSNGNEEERKKMYAQLTEWILAGKFRAPPIERIPLTDAINALDCTDKVREEDSFGLEDKFTVYRL